MAGSDIYKQAEHMEWLTNKHWKKFKDSLSSGKEKTKDEDHDMDADL
jgi:hypothetical protein